MKRQQLLLLILAFGVFSILNTEMGIIGILPMAAEMYQVDIVQADARQSVRAWRGHRRADDAVAVLALQSQARDAACAGRVHDLQCTGRRCERLPAPFSAARRAGLFPPGLLCTRL